MSQHNLEVNQGVRRMLVSHVWFENHCHVEVNIFFDLFLIFMIGTSFVKFVIFHWKSDKIVIFEKVTRLWFLWFVNLDWDLMDQDQQSNNSDGSVSGWELKTWCKYNDHLSTTDIPIYRTIFNAELLFINLKSNLI